MITYYCFFFKSNEKAKAKINGAICGLSLLHMPQQEKVFLSKSLSGKLSCRAKPLWGQLTDPPMIGHVSLIPAFQ